MGQNDSKFFALDTAITRDGDTFVATVQRTGLGVLGKKRNGEWIVDHEVVKFVSRIWPKVRLGQVKVRVGFQSLVDGPVTWKGYFIFNPEDGSLSPAMGSRPTSMGAGGWWR